MVPVLLTALLAYFIAAAFMYVVEVSIDTILMAFSYDVKHNDPQGKTPGNLFLHHDRCARASHLRVHRKFHLVLVWSSW